MTSLLSGPEGVTAGPDGALWFTSNGGVSRLSTGGVITNTWSVESTVSAIAWAYGAVPSDIIAGPDGALWFDLGFGEVEQNKSFGGIARITTAGVLASYGNGSPVASLTFGPDGAIWFAWASGCHGGSACLYDGQPIGRLTTAGVYSYSGGSTQSRAGVMSHVASGRGWKSSMYVLNPSATPVNITVNFWADDGSALTLPVTLTTTGGSQVYGGQASLNAAIGPYATVLIDSGSQDKTAVSGWAEVLSSAPIQGYGVFHYTSLKGIQSEGTMPLDTTFESSFLLPYDNVDGFQTGLALANLNASAPAMIAATIWDEYGSQLAVQTINLPVGGHTSSMLSDLLPATTVNRGAIQFRSISGGNITGLGLRVDPLGGITWVPKLPSAR